jgi:hypothetical protein
MIEADPKLKLMLARVESRARLPLKQMVTKAVDILRSTPAPKPRSAAIISARIHISNERSKLIESRLIIARELSYLRQLHADMSSFLIAKYTTGYLGSLKGGTRSREAVIDKALQPLAVRVARLESALEAINTVMGDLDAKAFTIRDIMEALKLGEKEA